MEDNKKPDHVTLEDSGLFIFSDEIDDKTIIDPMTWIMEANFTGAHSHLTLLINSPGGDVYAGFALIDVVLGSRIPIHTVGLGCIASMGLLLFISGKKGHRILTPHTTVMSHQWSGHHYGKEHELVSLQKHNSHLSNKILEHYKRHTGLSARRIRNDLLPASDVWLTPEEALAMGICDAVKAC